MYSELTIREAIIFFESEVIFHPNISIKLCISQSIYKFHDFEWDGLCHRWQRKDVLKIPWPTNNLIELEIYKKESDDSEVVLGEGSINLGMVVAYLNR